MGDYELESRIGKGSSGTVWMALRRGPTRQVVAVKRLFGESRSPDHLARLRREALVLTELDHPHIVRVLEVVEDGAGVAIAMQYAPGGSLETLLSERKRLAPGEVVAVAVPIAEALGSAHRRGILHVDVKPANILFTSDGEPLLGDFGVAQTLGRLTAVLGGLSRFAGTAHYIAPELLDDGATPDARSDVYALGVVCYEALTGEPPYDAVLPLAVLRAADAGHFKPLAGRPGIPPALAAVVEQAIARDPDRRFTSAADLAQALRAAVPPAEVHLPAPVPIDVPVHIPIVREGEDPPPPEPTGFRSRRFRLGALAAVACAVAAVLVLVRDLASDDRCADMAEPVVDAGAQVVEGDPEGDGCVTFGVYEPTETRDDMLLTIRIDGERRSIHLGEPDDRLFLGDWDCDGVDTPGLYRWTAGEVQYFDTWPNGGTLGEPARSDQVVARGKAALITEPGDCDRIEVRPGNIA